MKICFAHAHPDDETLASGALIAELVDAGHDVSVLTATRGEEGDVVPGPLSPLAGTPELEQHREQELAGALAELGVSRHAFLGTAPARASGPERRYRDSGMRWIREGLAGPADESDERSLCAANLDEAAADLAAWLRHTGAELAVSYAADGGYGHPDHVRMHHLTRAAADQCGIPFAALVHAPGDGVRWFPLEHQLPRMIRALGHHRSQLTVHGDQITHSGGQTEPVTTSVGLTDGEWADGLALRNVPRNIRTTASDVGARARRISAQVASRAGAVAMSTKASSHQVIDKFVSKKSDPYDDAIAQYNGAYTSLHDKGLTLLRQRERSVDLIAHVERLINSIAHTPRSFEADLHDVHVKRTQFIEAEDFARRDLEAARKSAAGAGLGITAGAAVASIAPSAALWVATTFGTASTGTAISTLSGAVASNAALAWLGGGALAAGGGGTAAGTALLTLAGPIGWSIAGASLLASIVLVTKKKADNREAKHEALLAIRRNTALLDRMDARVGSLLQRTSMLHDSLTASYGEALPYFGADFSTLTPAQQSQLAALVNSTKACAAQLHQRIGQVDHEQ